MNLRITGFLVLVAIAVGVVVIINPFEKVEVREPDDPWFYQVAMEDIITIQVTRDGMKVAFFKNEENAWEFEDPTNIPPFHNRWAGITLLLSGPQTRRDLTIAAQTIDDPAQYGLDDPDMIVDVGLTADRSLQFRLGDLTTDGGSYYGQVIGFPQLYLVVEIWGRVISRLATEPPVPKWYVERTAESIRELKLYRGDNALNETDRLRYRQDDGLWTVIDLPEETEPRPVDGERFAEIVQMLDRPDGITTAVFRVEDQDYTSWGITDDSRAIEVRFDGVTDQGTEYIDGVLLRLGDKTDDGTRYYALSESTLVVRPVLYVDADWADKLFTLFDDLHLAP